MKKNLKEVLILLSQLFMFYISPLFAGPTDAMGMVYLIWLSTIILGMMIVIISNKKRKYLYPVVIAILFIPSIFIYYNETALIHSIWYLISSSIGMFIGIIINLIIKKLSPTVKKRECKNLKKKIIITIIISIIILGIIIGISYKNYSNNKRYEIIKKEIDEETTKYLKISHPYCTPGTGDFTITEDELLYQRGMDKSKLLDIDKKSYCKVRIEVKCISENKLKKDVYLKCKNFEDENYSNWEERGKNGN